jgi:hypothetical protein
MEDRRRSDPKLGATSRRGSGEAAGAGTGTPSAWTGEKKPKIQSAPTSAVCGDIGVARDDDDESMTSLLLARLSMDNSKGQGRKPKASIGILMTVAGLGHWSQSAKAVGAR